MANFLKPNGVGQKGYDKALNRQSVNTGEDATVALWGGGPPPDNSPLNVALNNPAIGKAT